MMGDYTDIGGRRDYNRASHGDRYYDPETMDVRVYDESLDMWFKMTKEETMDKLPPPPIAMSGVVVPNIPMKTKFWPGDRELPSPGPDVHPRCTYCGELYKHCGCQTPEPPKPKPITDFDFDEEDFVL